MSKSLLDRSAYDHPEHFDDEIRAYRSSARYVPTSLESLLYELAGHKCMICHAPWLEIHHIRELCEGGSTEYENLIVLCPNCHTRVHAEGVPSNAELTHYKLKQEIAYELPVISRLTVEERQLVDEISKRPAEDWLIFSKRFHGEVVGTSHDTAIETFKREIGFFHLQEHAIVQVDLESAIGLAVEAVSVSLRIKLTGKGVRWLRYLVATGAVPAV